MKEDIMAVMQKARSASLTNQGSLHREPEKYKCVLCNDTGFIYDRGTNTCEFCQCRKVKEYIKLYERSGISKVFAGKTFDNYITTKRPPIVQAAKQVAQGYVRGYNGKNSIAFLGRVGAGKTHLCIAIANELMGRNIGVLYMQYREALTLLKQNIVRSRDDEEGIYQTEVNKFKTAPVLYIDDLYKGKITDSDKNIMFEIINYRYLNGLPIMVSSEYDMDKILDFDEGVGSRIVSMCEGFIVEFKGMELNYRLVM